MPVPPRDGLWGGAAQSACERQGPGLRCCLPLSSLHPHLPHILLLQPGGCRHTVCLWEGVARHCRGSWREPPEQLPHKSENIN